MGFLETRVLDFKYVFIASLNEGTLPGNAIPKSLIPYSLRKAYQLPCKEEQDAVTAYHFYRLLQRAQHVKLFYNSELNDMGGGEKSRYLLQLQYELTRLNPKLNIHYKQVNPIPEAPSKVIIEIPKSELVLKLLKEK
jgi:inactivated superfamily I helicase